MFCSKQVDNFGQDCLKKKKYKYMYREEVEIPPLRMVDNVLCISEWGFQTNIPHTYIKLKIESKKLHF